MKYTLLPLAFVMFAFAACTKNHDDHAPVSSGDQHLRAVESSMIQLQKEISIVNSYLIQIESMKELNSFDQVPLYRRVNKIIKSHRAKELGKDVYNRFLNIQMSKLFQSLESKDIPTDITRNIILNRGKSITDLMYRDKIYK